MNQQQVQLIKDNPNLSSSALESFLGVSRADIGKVRGKVLWKHSGCGIPFLSHTVGKNGLSYKLRTKNKTVVSCSSLDSAMINLDRLIYCLENNEGKLPMTTEEAIEDGLRFIKPTECKG